MDKLITEVEHICNVQYRIRELINSAEYSIVQKSTEQNCTVQYINFSNKYVTVQSSTIIKSA